jgi:hypothetical protein
MHATSCGSCPALHQGHPPPARKQAEVHNDEEVIRVYDPSFIPAAVCPHTKGQQMQWCVEAVQHHSQGCSAHKIGTRMLAAVTL